ncbi:MAG TPA: flagellar filament capping protein FliD [Clostridiaceae bacterium]|nr:flagellar filament capping protein FliD [Clostridiaceae bacterium]
MYIYGTSSTLYTNIRLSGLASGLDTDTIVQNLMRVERLPLDRLYQKKQLAEWRRDDYRSITNMLIGFRNEFFDVLKPAKDMRSPSIYQKYTSTSSHPQIVTATGGAGITSYSHSIKVTQLASAAKGTSSEMVSKSLVGKATGTITIDDYNNSFMLSYNGITKVITLKNGTYNSIADLLGNGVDDGLLRQQVREAFGGTVVDGAFTGLDIVANGSSLEFVTPNASDVVTISSNIVSDNFLNVLGVNAKGEGKELTFPIEVKKGQRFSVTIVETVDTGDGGTTTNTVTKEIIWAENKTYEDSEALAADIQNMINSQFGEGKVVVSGADGKLSFTTGEGIESITLKNSQKNTKVVGYLGFSSGDSNKLSMSDTVGKISLKLRMDPDWDPSVDVIKFDAQGKLKLTINNVDIEISANDTLAMVIDKINSSGAGVNLSYSSFTDTFTLVAKNTGAGTITLDDNGSNFFKNIRLETVEPGTDAVFELDGIVATRRTNSFTIDGVTYNLLGVSANGEKVTINLQQDVDATFNAIKEFVDKYNEILDTINKKLSEKYDRDYLPLTSDQKNAMSEDEIKKWEEKAKTGLLRNDSTLETLVSTLRRALYDAIDGVSGGLYSIGISTGSYFEKGKLIIDENKLREAIRNTPDKVMNIFAKSSSIAYSVDLDSESRRKRYNESGIINRLDDILKDYVRTTRDASGRKGILIEKAGIAGDTSDITNTIYKEIAEYDREISRLTQLLIEKENTYYLKFIAMEKALSQMNSQSNWLMAQLGMGN